MSDWETILDNYSRMIEQEVSRFLDEEIKKATVYHNFIKNIYIDLHEFLCRKGKRLASSSILLVYKGFTDEIDDRILSVCVGMEIYRHAILVHDDLVDKDELRRGEETIHIKYSKEYDTRFGESLAVFAGDILYTLALKAFSHSKFDPPKIAKMIDLVNDAFQAVNESQILDLLFEYKIPDVDEWYVMASKRAASLFKVSLSIGAVLANASDKDIHLIEETAEHIGYCFDIQDDIIDTYASEKQYGRKPGEDLYKNKKPLHIVYTYKKANPLQLKTFTNAIRKKNSGNLSQIRKVISNSGALDAAKNLSREHADQAKKSISETGMNGEIKNFFISFIDYIKDSLNWYK